MRRLHLVAALIAVTALAASPASAQISLFDVQSDARPMGWTFTPSAGYAAIWDDNALIRGEGDVLPGDFTNSINPRLSVDFHSRRSEFSGVYDGSLVAYRELTELNSFDQRGSVNGRRLLTRRVAWFGQAAMAESPTTELLGVIGVPYVRIGSQMADGRTGIEVTPSRHTSIHTDYNFQWISFDPDPIIGLQMRGGTSHGTATVFRHSLDRRIVVLADYNLQLATVVDGGHFLVQNGQGGVEFEPGASFRLYGTFGFARLSYSEIPEPKLGPALRLGVSRRLRTGGAWDASYSRAFVPTFGFTGTSQNEELSTRLLTPLGRRFYTRGSVAWRRNEPLITGDLRLKSFWIEGGLGYTATPWMRLEGFYDGTRQEIERPGGHLVRNRVGMQVITVKPMRIH